MAVDSYDINSLLSKDIVDSEENTGEIGEGNTNSEIEPMLRLEDIEDFVRGEDRTKENKDNETEKDEQDKENKEENKKKAETVIEELESTKETLNTEKDIKDKEIETEDKENEEKESSDKEDIQEDKELNEDKPDESTDKEESEVKEDESDKSEDSNDNEGNEEESEEDSEDSDVDDSEDEQEDETDENDNEEEADDQEDTDEDEEGESEEEDDENDDSEDEENDEETEPDPDEEHESEEYENEENQDPEQDEYVFDEVDEPEESEESDDYDEQDNETEIEESEYDNESLQEDDKEEKTEVIEEPEEPEQDDKNEKEEIDEPEKAPEDTDESESEIETDDENSDDSEEDEDSENEEETTEDNADKEETTEEDNDDGVDDNEEKTEENSEEDVQEDENADSFSEPETFEVDIDELVVYNQEVPDIDVVDFSEDISVETADIPELEINDNIPHDVISPSQVKDLMNLAAGKTNITELGMEKAVKEIKSVSANAIASATGIPAPVIEAVMEFTPKALGITAPMFLPMIDFYSKFDKAEDTVILDSGHIPSQDRLSQELDHAVNEYCEAASGGDKDNFDFLEEDYDDSFMADIIDDPSHYDMSQQGFDNAIEDENIVDFNIEEGPELTEAENATDPFEYEMPIQEFTYKEPEIVESEEVESDYTEGKGNWVDTVADVWGWFEEKIFDTPEDEQWSEYWRDSMHGDFDDSLFKVEEYFWFGADNMSAYEPVLEFDEDNFMMAGKTVYGIRELDAEPTAQPLFLGNTVDLRRTEYMEAASGELKIIDNMGEDSITDMETLRENNTREQEQIQLREVERMVNTLNFDISSDLTVGWDMDRITSDLFEEPMDMCEFTDVELEKESPIVIAL